jgi:hypothetical protein
MTGVADYDCNYNVWVFVFAYDLSLFLAGGSLNRTNSFNLRDVQHALTDGQSNRRMTNDSQKFSTLLSINEPHDGLNSDENDNEEGGVDARVLEDLKEAFGTDFKVDSALIDAIHRRNCIAFVGAGFRFHLPLSKQNHKPRNTIQSAADKDDVGQIDTNAAGITAPPPPPSRWAVCVEVR